MEDLILFLRGPLLFSKKAGQPYSFKYFVLRDLEGTVAILDYVNNKPGQIQLYIQLFGCKVGESKEEEHEEFYPFVLECADGKGLYLAGKTPNERSSWVTAFREAILVAPEIAEDERHKEIEKQLLNEKKNKAKLRELVLLLLGPGESGKSTVVKQIKILTCNGFSDQEIEFYRHLCRQNIVEYMKELLDISRLLHIELSVETQSLASNFLQRFDTATNVPLARFELPQETASAIKALWADPNIRENTMSRADAHNIGVSALYFFNALDRITDEKYVPTTEDILRARYRTTSVHETLFSSSGSNFRVIDVGGQRGERKKWVPLFSDVTAIIFVAAISEYDQKLLEDENANRLKESLEVFKEVCTLKALRKTAIILMLNKMDLFAEKIKRIPLSVCFSDYTGGNNYKEASDYIYKQFENLKQNSSRTVYAHFTCATDTQSFKSVLTAVTDIIISAMLDEQF